MKSVNYSVIEFEILFRELSCLYCRRAASPPPSSSLLDPTAPHNIFFQHAQSHDPSAPNAPAPQLARENTPEKEQDTPMRVLTRRGTRGSGVKPNDYLTGPYVMLWKSGEITVQKFADTIDAVQKYMKDIKTRRGKIRAQKLRRWQFEQEKVETTDGKGGRLKYEKQFGPLKEWMAKKGNEGVTKIPK